MVPEVMRIDKRKSAVDVEERGLYMSSYSPYLYKEVRHAGA